MRSKTQQLLKAYVRDPLLACQQNRMTGSFTCCSTAIRSSSACAADAAVPASIW